MKKMIITLNNNGYSSIEDFYGGTVDSLNEEEFTKVVMTIMSLSNTGDLWFRHYYQESDKNYLVYIFDSEDAVNNFNDALEVIENIPGFESVVTQEITFEEFANFASENDETTIANERVNNMLVTE